MNRYASEQLMTVEEAERLCGLRPGRDEREDRRGMNKIVPWAWQSVAGALSQRTSEEQVDQVMDLLRRK